jgi:thioredoxin reductase
MPSGQRCGSRTAAWSDYGAGVTGAIPTQVEVLVIGAGPAGLSAATALAARVDGTVLVLDREPDAGGIPRHSDHTGYGVRDLKTFLKGPAYARRLVANAIAAGAVVRTSTMVTGWDSAMTVEVTSPAGRQCVQARAIVLATGARERPRAARLVPGDRPPGVYTTGQLQNLVHLHHANPGRHAVVVGAELVSWSAVLTLRHAGARTVLMTTEHPSPETYAAVRVPGRLALRVPIATRTAIARIIGRDRVRAVELEDLDTGARRQVECDTVVFTGDWIPDHELVRTAGLRLDPNTRGPLVDTAQRTSAAGVFAIGNLVHPVDTADIAALDGHAVGDQVVRYLRDGHRAPAGRSIQPGAGLTWITPGLVRPGDPAPPRNKLLAWPDTSRSVARVAATQGGRIIGQRTLAWGASPGRALHIPFALLRDADEAGGPITVSLD